MVPRRCASRWDGCSAQDNCKILPLTSWKRDLRENGLAELGYHPWRSPARATRQLASRLPLRGEAWTSRFSIYASRSRCSVDKGSWTGLALEERDTEALHEPRRPSAATPTCSSACVESSSHTLPPPQPFTADSIRDLRLTLLLLLKTRARLSH